MIQSSFTTHNQVTITRRLSQFMKKTIYFCDKCGKETKDHMNGDITKNLYSFKIDNVRKFPGLDEHAEVLELCGECSAIFASLVKDFYDFCLKEPNIYFDNTRAILKNEKQVH